MVLHGQCASRSCLTENATKVNQLWGKCNGGDSEDTEQAELDGQYLVCTGDFNRDAHGELFILVARWIFVLLDKEAVTCL